MENYAPKRLWAPWRIEYIKIKKPKSCIFCLVLKEGEENDRKNLVVYRGKFNFIVLNKYPYNIGHLMVVPYKHTGELNKLKKEEVIEFFALINKSVEILKKTLRPDGFNIGMNIGKVSGAGVEKHVHIHIVPRWSGDVNFMPVIAETKVISESLDSVWKKLRDAL